MTRLFLDDERIPKECLGYMHTRVGPGNFEYLKDWVIVRNYNEFVKHIKENGVPDLVSFDHDLADEHYSGLMNSETDDDYNSLYDSFREKTGLCAVKWLCNYCAENNIDFPKHFTHSQNPIGVENIESYIRSFLKSIL